MSAFNGMEDLLQDFLTEASELLAEPPKIEKLEVLAAKLPSRSVEKAA